ncbi:MAG: hypothetical protein ACI4SZ_05415, partial [Lachnospiraceae bacterium]
MKSGLDKIQRNITAVLLALAVGTVLSPAVISYADNDTDKIKQSIKEKQSAIDEAQKQKATLQSGLSDVKKMVADLEASKKNLKDYVV